MISKSVFYHQMHQINWVYFLQKKKWTRNQKMSWSNFIHGKNWALLHLDKVIQLYFTSCMTEHSYGIHTMQGSYIHYTVYTAYYFCSGSSSSKELYCFGCLSFRADFFQLTKAIYLSESKHIIKMDRQHLRLIDLWYERWTEVERQSFVFTQSNLVLNHFFSRELKHFTILLFFSICFCCFSSWHHIYLLIG